MSKPFQLDRSRIHEIPYLYMLHELSKHDEIIRHAIDKARPFDAPLPFWTQLGKLRDEWYPTLIFGNRNMRWLPCVVELIHTLMHTGLSTWLAACLQQNTAPIVRLDARAINDNIAWQNRLTYQIQGKYLYPELEQIVSPRRTLLSLGSNVLLSGVPTGVAGYFGNLEETVPLAIIGLLLSENLNTNRHAKQASEAPVITSKIGMAFAHV